MQGRRARRWLIVSSVVALAATGVPQPAFAAAPPGDGPGLVEGFRNFLGLDEDDTEAAEPPALPDTGVPRNDLLPKGRDAAPAKRIKELEDLRTPNARYWQLSDGRVQSEVSAVPTHYRAGKDWKAVDTAVRATQRRGFTHANTTNVARTYFGERPG
ncbi:hypothetical protein AB0K02_21550 [Streptomyces sp. NPDC049597]|uniref:hypothetical protein n=1 Tax=Streptomyces sp. NPDC049597 TaxID=3155276 RepID=UPI00342ED452